MNILNLEKKGIELQSIILPNQKIYYLKQTNEYFLTFQDYSLRNKELVIATYTPLLANMKANIYQCAEYDMQKTALISSLPLDFILTIFNAQEREFTQLPQQTQYIGGLIKDSNGQYGVIVQQSANHLTIHQLEDISLYSQEVSAMRYYVVNQQLFQDQQVKEIMVQNLSSTSYPKYDQQNNLIISMAYKYFKTDDYIRLFTNGYKMQPKQTLQLILDIKQDLMDKIQMIRKTYTEKLNLDNQNQISSKIYIDQEQFNLVPLSQCQNTEKFYQEPFINLQNPPSLMHSKKMQKSRKQNEKQQQQIIKPINEQERKLQMQVMKKLVFSDIQKVIDEYFDVTSNQISETTDLMQYLSQNGEQSDGINLDELNERADLLIQQGIDRDRVSAFREQVMLPLDFQDIEQTINQWVEQQGELSTTSVVPTKRQSTNEIDILQNSENLREFIKENMDSNDNILVDEIGFQAIKAFQFISQYAELLNCQHMECVDFIKAFTFNKQQKIMTDNTLITEEQIKQIQEQHPELSLIFPMYNNKINIMIYQIMTKLATFLFQTEGVQISDKRTKKKDFIQNLYQQGQIQQKQYEQYIKEMIDDGEQEYIPSDQELEEEDEEESESQEEYSSSNSQQNEDDISSYTPEEEQSDNNDQDDLSSESFVVSSDEEQYEEQYEDSDVVTVKVSSKQETTEQQSEQEKSTTEKVISLRNMMSYRQLQTFYYKREQQIYVNRGSTDDIFVDRIVHYIISKLWQKCDFMSLYRILPILYKISDNFAIKQMLCGLENKNIAQRYQFTNKFNGDGLFNQMPIDFLNELFGIDGKHIDGEGETIAETIQRQVTMLEQYEKCPKCTFQELDYQYQFELLNWLIEQVLQTNSFEQYSNSLYQVQQQLQDQRKQIIQERATFNQKEQKAKREKEFNDETIKLQNKIKEIQEKEQQTEQQKQTLTQLQQQLQQRSFRNEEQQRLNQIRDQIQIIDKQLSSIELINNNLLITTDTLQNSYYYIDYDENHKILMNDIENRCYRILSCDTIRAIEPYLSNSQLMEWNQKTLNLDELLVQSSIKTNYKPIQELKDEQIIQQRQINALLKQQDIPQQFNYMIDTTGYGFTFLSQENQQIKLRQIWQI